MSVPQDAVLISYYSQFFKYVYLIYDLLIIYNKKNQFYSLQFDDDYAVLGHYHTYL